MVIFRGRADRDRLLRVRSNDVAGGPGPAAADEGPPSRAAAALVWDVVVTHADADVAWARWLCWHLADAGYRVTTAAPAATTPGTRPPGGLLLVLWSAAYQRQATSTPADAPSDPRALDAATGLGPWPARQVLLVRLADQQYLAGSTPACSPSTCSVWTRRPPATGCCVRSPPSPRTRPSTWSPRRCHRLPAPPSPTPAPNATPPPPAPTSRHLPPRRPPVRTSPTAGSRTGPHHHRRGEHPWCWERRSWWRPCARNGDIPSRSRSVRPHRWSSPPAPTPACTCGSCRSPIRRGWPRPSATAGGSTRNGRGWSPSAPTVTPWPPPVTPAPPCCGGSRPPGHSRCWP